MTSPQEPGQLLNELAEIMDKLRSPAGCPWDREQDHLSLRPYLIEEAYEVLEAIQLGDPHKLAEELGDLLLQVVLHAQIADEEGHFNLTEPIRQIIAKIRRRHPHVFGDVGPVATSDEVRANWEAIKARERQDQERQPLLAAVPHNMPGLIQAYKVQQKAALVGFDWDSIEGAWAKVAEEQDELQKAIARGQQEAVFEEMGDFLFALVNVARFLEVEPETALLATVMKFRRRFAYVEKEALAAGRELSAYSLQELDFWWEEAKKLD